MIKNEEVHKIVVIKRVLKAGTRQFIFSSILGILILSVNTKFMNK